MPTSRLQLLYIKFSTTYIEVVALTVRAFSILVAALFIFKIVQINFEVIISKGVMVSVVVVTPVS